MISISEIRKKYPQYSDLSDQELADSLHSKHYSDMPKEDFYSKINLQPSVMNDISESLAGAPDQLMNAFSSLIREAPKSAKQLFQHPIRAAENLGAGLGEGVIGAINAPSNIGQYMQSRGIPGGEALSKYSPQVGDLGVEKYLGLDQPQEGDELLRAIGSYAPYSRIGAGAKGLAGLAQKGAGGALYGAGQNQDPLQSALMIMGMEGGLKVPGAAMKGLGALRPSEMFKGKLSPEELQQNFAITKGTNTPLGDVLQSPTLKFLFENVGAETPFGGGKKSLENIKSQVEDRAKMIEPMLDQEHFEGDLNEHLQRALSTAHKTQQKAKNKLYEERDRIAEESNHQLTTPGFSKSALDAMSLIEESPGLRTDPKFLKLYRTLAGLGSKGDKAPTLSDATLLKSRLNSEGTSYLRSSSANDRAIGSKFIELSQSLDKDIKNSIDTNENPKLKESHDKATQNYKQNYSPFLDKYIHKAVRPDFNAETMINDVIKPGRLDKYKNIQKIQNLLPEKDKTLIGHAYLQDAYNNPKALAQKIKALGPRQMEALFPNKNIQSALQNFGKLRGMNEEALNVMFNPKTGARNTKNILGAAEALSAFAPLIHGNPIPLLTNVAAPALAARLLNKALTSPKVRKSIVNKIIDKKTSPQKAQSILSKALSASAKGAARQAVPLELTLTRAQGKE